MGDTVRNIHDNQHPRSSSLIGHETGLLQVNCELMHAISSAISNSHRSFVDRHSMLQDHAHCGHVAHWQEGNM